MKKNRNRIGTFFAWLRVDFLNWWDDIVLYYKFLKGFYFGK